MGVIHRKRAHRRTMAMGVAVSAGIHLAILSFGGMEVLLPEEDVDRPSERTAISEPSIELVRLSEILDAPVTTAAVTTVQQAESPPTTEVEPAPASASFLGELEPVKIAAPEVGGAAMPQVAITMPAVSSVLPTYPRVVAVARGSALSGGDEEDKGGGWGLFDGVTVNIGAGGGLHCPPGGGSYFPGGVGVPGGMGLPGGIQPLGAFARPSGSTMVNDRGLSGPFGPIR